MAFFSSRSTRATSAPLPNNCFAMAVWPLNAAAISGVTPLTAARLTSVPAARTFWARSTLSLFNKMTSALSPSRLRELTSAPSASARSRPVASALRAATRKRALTDRLSSPAAGWPATPPVRQHRSSMQDALLRGTVIILLAPGGIDAPRNSLFLAATGQKEYKRLAMQRLGLSSRVGVGAGLLFRQQFQ